MKFYLLFGVIAAQRKQWFGKCPEPTVLSDFDLARVSRLFNPCGVSSRSTKRGISMPFGRLFYQSKKEFDKIQ